MVEWGSFRDLTAMHEAPHSFHSAKPHLNKLVYLCQFASGTGLMPSLLNE